MSRAVLTEHGDMVIALDDPDEPGRKAVLELAGWAIEVEGDLCVIPSDGWVETAWKKGLLVADVVAYPRYRPSNDAGDDPDDNTERSVLDPAARRLLRVSARCPKRPTVSSRILVAECQPGASDEDILQSVGNGGIVFFSAVPLHRLVLDDDPTAVITTSLRGVEGIEEAYVSGSWAACRVGERSSLQVIDIAVVGSPSQNDLHRAAVEAGHTLGCDMNPRVVLRADDHTGQDVFLATVWSRPLIRLQLN